MVTYTWKCNQCGIEISYSEDYYADGKIMLKLESQFWNDHGNHEVGV
jgi:hypothetical protein